MMWRVSKRTRGAKARVWVAGLEIERDVVCRWVVCEWMMLNVLELEVLGLLIVRIGSRFPHGSMR